MLNNLRTEMDRLLQRLAKEHQDEKRRIVFLLNNTDHMLTVLTVSTKKKTHQVCLLC
jgi:hypothetical protein